MVYPLDLYLYLLQKSSSLLQGMIHTNLVYSNDEQGKVSKNVNLTTPGTAALVLGRGPYVI